MSYNPPLWLFWLLLSASVIVAAYLTYRELKRGFAYHQIAWGVYDNLGEALRNLTFATDRIERAKIHADIQRERGKVPDPKLDEMITLYLEAEAERYSTGMNPYDDKAQSFMNSILDLMRKHFRKKYGERIHGKDNDKL